jgi:hypothetical protein
MFGEFRPDNGLSGNYPVVPVKSHFEQVHRVSEFGGLNLVKTPFIVRFPAPCAVPSRRLSDPDLRRRGSQPLTTREQIRVAELG